MSANDEETVHDVVIVGGGPAGLSAALVLGRCRRRVLVFDHGRPRNAATRSVHGLITRDGIGPFELLRLAREELRPYGVKILGAKIVSARRRADGFEVTAVDGSRHRSRRLLLATGVRDHVPDIPGIDALYGTSVHHCPYCDGWESREKAIAVHGRGDHGAGLALSLKTWSDDVVLCTDGPARLREARRRQLRDNGIDVLTDRIERLEGEGGMLRRIIFAGGGTVDRDVLFFSAGQDQSADLAVQLGCRLTRKGAIWTNRKEGTGVPGLYVVGDASRDVQMVVIAAAEGATAAVALNTELQREEVSTGDRDGG